MPELRKLKGRMREKGVTGIQLAAMIGKERNYVYAICNGKVSPRIDQAYIICRALDIPPEAMTFYFPEGSEQQCIHTTTKSSSASRRVSW